MNNEERQRLIIKYIENHPGTLTERVCEELAESMSRRTYFNQLAILKVKGKVIDKLINKRDKGLYVNKNNLLILVPKELEQFENDFLKLAQTVSIKLEKLYLNSSLENNRLNKIFTPAEIYLASYQLLLNILFRVVDSYILRYLIKWSSSNLKEEDKVQLFIIIFAKVSKILFEISKLFKFLKLDNGNPNLYPQIINRLEGVQPILRFKKLFSIFKIDNHVNKVINNIWNLDNEICEFVYQEPKYYNFDFDYKKDDWKKLVEEYEHHLSG